MSGPDVLAVAVANASVELQRAIANRTQAKKARKAEIKRYADEHGEDYSYYPIADGYGVEYIDAGVENAIATVNGASAVVTAARGKWRRATTSYARSLGGAA